MASTKEIIQKGFYKIVRQRDIHRSRPLQGAWDPYLSDFLMSVSARIRNNTKFYPDFIDLNRIKIENTAIYHELRLRMRKDTKSSTSVLVGRVGTGKTSFLKWIRNEAERRLIFISKIDYNLFPTPDTKQAKDIKFKGLFQEILDHALNRFCEYFNNKLQNEKGFRTNLNTKIRLLKNKTLVDDFPNWGAGFISQSIEFRKNFPNYDKIWLLSALINSANDTFGKPVWMIFDNIDRLAPTYQKIVIQVSHSIYERVLEISRSSGWYTGFHIITTARPETVLLNDFDFEQFLTINYPNPRIVSIAKKRLFDSLDEVALEQQDMSTLMVLGENEYQGTTQVAYHIKKSINNVFEKFSNIKQVPRTRLGSDKWHLDLISNNIRRFIKPWAAMVLSGNFVNDLIFPDDSGEINQEFSVHRYFKLLIKGRYNYYYGNEKIDGYGFNENSPLFFNLFGFPRPPGKNNLQYSNNYLIFVRILQYLIGHEYGSGVRFGEFIKNLSKFFDKKAIINATKILLWTRIIDEVNTGARDIGPSANCRSIKFRNDSALVSTDTTKLYFHTLLREYDYISSMAIVSYQLTHLTTSRKYAKNPVKSIEIAESAFTFLDSWVFILLDNYNKYKNDGVLDNFIEFFLTKSSSSRPWQKAISNCISALELKSKFATEAGSDEKSDILKEIMLKMIELRKNGTEQINNILGDIYSNS